MKSTFNTLTKTHTSARNRANAVTVQWDLRFLLIKSQEKGRNNGQGATQGVPLRMLSVLREKQCSLKKPSYYRSVAYRG